MLHTAFDRTPYTYLIGWSSLNKWYYGSRYGERCHPDDLWVVYKTSSKYVKQYVADHGEPDIIQVRKTFTSIESAMEWEGKVLRRLKASRRDDFLNETEITYTPYQKRKWMTDGTKSKFVHPQEIETYSNNGWYFGRTFSDSHKKAISVNCRNSGENNPRYGKPVSKETRQRMSVNWKGKLPGYMALSEEQLEQIKSDYVNRTVPERINKGLKISYMRTFTEVYGPKFNLTPFTIAKFLKTQGLT